jgi:hypothetical protein
MNNYSKLSAEELREMLLNDELSHELMTEEDYTALLDIESEYDATSEKVIDFCHAGLSVMPKYSRIKERDFDIYELMNTAESVKIIRRGKKLKKAIIIAAALIASMLVAQLAASAMGFDLFGYVFNWNKPEVIEVTNESINASNNGGDTEIEYFEIDEIPAEMKNLVPNYIFDSYEFLCAFFIRLLGDEVISFYFLNENDKMLSIEVKKHSELHIEKDNDGYFEEYSFGGIDYTIFTNMGSYTAFWIDGDYLYIVYTHFEDLQDIKNLLNNIY